MNTENTPLHSQPAEPAASGRRHRSRSARSKTRIKRIAIIFGVVLAASAAGFGAYALFFQKDSADYLEAAQHLAAKGEAGSAMIEFKNALQADPANLEARLGLARIYYARNQFDAAEKEFQAATKTGAHAEALPQFARTLLYLNQQQRVLDEVRPAPTASPEVNAEILALRARAQLALGDLAGFESSLQQADALQAEHPASQTNRSMRLAQQGQPIDALALAEAALLKHPKQMDLLLIKGDLLAHLKRLPDALTAYNQAVGVEPTNLRALMASANLHIQLNQLDPAHARLEAALKVSPNNVIVRYQQAALAFKQGRLPEALAKVEEVLKTAPDFLPARLLSGTAALASGRVEAARKDLEYVVAQSPDNPVARKLLAVLKMQAGQDQEARQLLSKLDPALLDDPMLLAAQGNMALRNRDFDQARSNLERAVELRPDQPRLLTELAASQYASGDEAAAIASLEQAAELAAAGAEPDLLLIQTHMKAKRYDAALKVIDRLEKRDPKAPVVANLRGGVAAAQGDLAQARMHFSRALQLQQAYLPAANNLAQLDIQAKDFKAAQKRFEQVIQNDPKNAGAWISLARLAALQKDEKAYLERLEKAIQADTQNIPARELHIRYWLAKRDYPRAINAAREAISATSQPAFYDLLGSAQALSGNKTEALSAFAKWTEAAPKSAQAHLRLAQAQEIGGKRTDALATLDKALKLAPDLPDAVLSKAILLGAQGKIEDGLKIARDYQKRFGTSFVGFAAEGALLVQAKRPAEAAKFYERAANLSGQSGFILQARAAYQAAGQAQAAEKSLSDWLIKQPKDSAVRHALAQTRLNAGDIKPAIAHYETLVKANPQDLVALNNLAWAYGQIQDGRAVITSEQAYQLQPKNPAVLDTHGWLLVQTGQVQKGISLLRQAVELQPEAAEIRWHLASALARSGDKAQAVIELDRLLASRIPFPQATEARALLQKLQTAQAKAP